MYQLGLGAATVEVPGMSVALGANRWASRVVVVLQLAAWSAVGIVLLQKGVSSLQRTSAETRNSTKANYTETVAIPTVQRENGVADSTGDDPDLLMSDDKNPEPKTIAGFQKEDEIPRKTMAGNIPVTSFTANHLSSDKKRLWNEKNPQLQDHGDQLDRKGFPPRDVQNDDNYVNDSRSSANYATTTTAKYETVPETVRRKNRPPNINGGGTAAAAVAMVAVGAVMLILGPIVIILRAVDERRQERRFLKLAGQDDLPPSYEQATLMDEAPRYSTLSLNTINLSTAAIAAGTTSVSAGCTASPQQANDPAAEDVGEIREV